MLLCSSHCLYFSFLCNASHHYMQQKHCYQFRSIHFHPTKPALHLHACGQPSPSFTMDQAELLPVPSQMLPISHTSARFRRHFPPRATACNAPQATSSVSVRKNMSFGEMCFTLWAIVLPSLEKASTDDPSTMMRRAASVGASAKPSTLSLKSMGPL